MSRSTVENMYREWAIGEWLVVETEVANKSKSQEIKLVGKTIKRRASNRVHLQSFDLNRNINNSTHL